MHRVKNQNSAVVVLVSLLALVPMSVQADCVVLLHGLARSSRAMVPLEDELRSKGYRVANVDYPSRKMPIEELSEVAVDSGLRSCATESSERVHFVTHSMGGILIRYFLEDQEIDRLGHVVMIAPPNQGSEIVDEFSGMPGFAAAGGPAGLQLGTDENSIPSSLGRVEFSLGVIAGTRTFNPLLSRFLPNQDDGKVTVESTKVSGMSDFRTVSATHTFIMRDKDVIAHVLSYIKSGAFLPVTP